VQRPRLAVIVPAYNEEARIGATLDAMTQYFLAQPYAWEVWVVDDGSTDGTAAAVEARAAGEPRIRLLRSSPNRGKGHAVRLGMLQAEADFLLLSDADLATPIEEVEKLWAGLEGRDVAIGSRPLKESRLEIRQPPHREILGRAFNFAVQALAVPGIHDTQCGFKLFPAAIARDVFSRCKLDGFGFDFEALMVARDLGYTIAEVPVRWRHQEGSKVVLMRDGPRMLADLVRLRIQGKRRRTAKRAG
jgi:dolichyl-phosphate beta-glucosyltransferase